MVERVITSTILKLGKKFPVVAVTGPRQSGKSTLIKNIFKIHNYISLEDIDAQSFAVNDPRGFLREFSGPCIIDEVQRAPQLFNYIQGIVDKTNKSTQYVLSGSQNFLLMESMSQSLAGRVALFKLLPFSYTEINHLKNKPKNADEAIFKGFYPRLYDKKIDPTFFYESYAQTYIERDIRLMKNIGDLSKFIKFLKLCAGRTGQLLNIQGLANEAGITQPTAKAWLSVLEASYIVFLLQPFHNNVNKRLVKSPKLYFYDTGLVSHLLDISNAKQISTHYLRGNLFENLVVSEIFKSFYNKGINPKLYFWRDSNQQEVDLVWQDGSNLNKIEIKNSSTVNESFFSNIHKMVKNKILPNGKNYIIMNEQEKKRWHDFNISDWRSFKL